MGRGVGLKSKKWARRRKVKIILKSDNGWHKTLKYNRKDFQLIEEAAKLSNETIEEFFISTLRKHQEC